MVPLYYSGEVITLPEIADIYGFKARSIDPSFTAFTKVGILKSRVGRGFENRDLSFTKNPK